MPTNLELKAAIPSVAAAHRTALEAGGDFRGAMRQTDTYFVVPRGRLKLREIEGQPAELIAYERPETTQTRWSLYTKSAIPEPAIVLEMLGHALGVLATVRKTRELFILEGSRIHLDTVETLGAFLEFEVPVRENGESEARGAMDRLRQLFVVRDKDIILPSYSDLILTGVPSGRTGARP